MARYAIVLAVLLALTAGCSKGGSTQQQARKIKPKDSVFSSQFKEMDKAKGVQQTMMNGAARERRQLDSQAQ